MAASVKHKFSCLIADDPEAALAGEVVPSNWNDEHDISIVPSDIGALSIASTVTPYTGASAIPITDQVVLGSGTFTLTLPTAATITGKTYHIKNIGTGVVTIAANGAQLIDGASTISLIQHEAITIVSDNTNWWII